MAWYVKKKFSTISVLSPSFLESIINLLLLSAPHITFIQKILYNVQNSQKSECQFVVISDWIKICFAGISRNHLFAPYFTARIKNPCSHPWYGDLTSAMVWLTTRLTSLKKFFNFLTRTEKKPETPNLMPDLDSAGSERLFTQNTLSIQRGNTQTD